MSANDAMAINKMVLFTINAITKRKAECEVSQKGKCRSLYLHNVIHRHSSANPGRDPVQICTQCLRISGDVVTVISRNNIRIDL